MTNAYLPFYFEWAKMLSKLEDEDYGKLVKSILAYAMGKPKKPKLSPAGDMAYDFITAAIARSEVHRKNGQKGALTKAKKKSEEETCPTYPKSEEKNKRVCFPLLICFSTSPPQAVRDVGAQRRNPKERSGAGCLQLSNRVKSFYSHRLPAIAIF